MKKLKIAILGSNSHIAKGLIYNFLQSGAFSLDLYTRSPSKVRSFLGVIGKSRNKDCVIHAGYGNFLKSSYNVAINCVGVGTLNKLRGNFAQYFTVTEEYDNLVINFLRNIHPECLYICFSSGAVYGRHFSKPVTETTNNIIPVNHVAAEDYYSIARLNSEAKHRAFPRLRIIDLRLFSYFSRFIDLRDGYLITEALNCILNKKVLITDNVNLVRDYVHPKDLFSIIGKCLDSGNTNKAASCSTSTRISMCRLLLSSAR